VLPVKPIRLGVLALAAALTLPAVAQTASAPTATDVEILAVRVKTEKRRLVSAALALTDSEASAFWPVYETYQKDLDAIDGRLGRAIDAYAYAYNCGPVPNETAEKLLYEFLDIERDEAELKRSYIVLLAAALPGVKVARYIQVEGKLRDAVRYQLALGLPLVQ
jgi:hypothetical protein